jgi:hypothetical protein
MTLITNQINLKNLYQTDENLWLEETIKMLKYRQFTKLDLDNLIQELEALSRRDKNKVASLIEQVIIHLLSLKYWSAEQEYNAGHWRGEILSFRGQLNRLCTTNLRNYLEQELPNLYDRARKIAINKAQIKNLPKLCPYSLEQLLDEAWLP